MTSIKTLLPYLQNELLSNMEQFGIIKSIPAGEEIMREGQYAKVIPIVLEGVIKVFTRQDDKELLLYYIEAGESCIMSFNAILQSVPGKIFAITEDTSTLLLIPADKVREWVKEFPTFNHFFYSLYNSRYASLLDTINHLLYNRLDERLFNYLLEISRRKQTKILKLRHREIASELGTAREVITRTMKKLEHEGKLKQHAGQIEII